MNLIFQKPRPDTVGAITSLLCIVHCIATPFVFLAQTCTMDTCAISPFWWSSMDYVFLLVSFLSICHATQSTRNTLMKPILWSNWSVLFLLITNEKLELFSAPETITYIVAFSLAVVHIYNLKYCQCKDDNCCVKNR